MAFNFAEKYSQQVDERFRIGSLTESFINREYDWAGVNTVNVYSIPTVQMTNYDMSGSARYGTPEELQAGVQTMTLERDRAFTFTIDKRNYESTKMTTEAGKALARQIEEVVIPEIDTYRIAQLVAAAGTTSGAAITEANAYDTFLTANNELTELGVPLAGRVAIITPRVYKAIKLDSAFIRSSDISQEMLITGQIGMVDGVPLILVPGSYVPSGVGLIMTHTSALVAPVKLAEYKVHDNPPGINGWLVEGRIVYDAFVLDNKKDSIFVNA